MPFTIGLDILKSKKWYYVSFSHNYARFKIHSQTMKFNYLTIRQIKSPKIKNKFFFNSFFFFFQIGGKAKPRFFQT